MINPEKNLRKGIYEHYKKKYYEVIDVARHSETLEHVVVYRMLADDFSLWVRPLSMFLEQINIEGTIQPRFKFICSQNAEEFLNTQQQ
jgi:hypothetical protein